MQISLKTPKFNFLAYLQLIRPANIVTAWADILAGLAVSYTLLENYTASIWLLLATTGLYSGGIIFNDVCDAEIDAIERPERPIPSDRVSLIVAVLLGVFLLGVGILAAAQVSLPSAILAALIATAALLYDRWGKHHPLFGPLNMGVCRGGNLLLGISAVPSVISERYYLAFIPILYIAAVTAISRGEVQGGKQATGVIALGLLGAVLGSLCLLQLTFDYHFLAAFPFWILLAGRVIPIWIKATNSPQPETIRQAVKVGVIALIILNATLAAGFAGILSGLLILSLLPLSLALARIFAVT